MHGNAGILSTIINFVIIFFVINLVTKAIKKSKNMRPGNNRSDKDNNADRETQLNMSPGAKDLKHENAITNKADLTLKRCSNCGGEIPLAMMKCDLCGHRQTGCGVGIIVIILVLGVFMMLIFNQGVGSSLIEYYHSIIQWLANL